MIYYILIHTSNYQIKSTHRDVKLHNTCYYNKSIDIHYELNKLNKVII